MGFDILFTCSMYTPKAHLDVQNTLLKIPIHQVTGSITQLPYTHGFLKKKLEKLKQYSAAL